MRKLLAVVPLVLVAACGMNGTDNDDSGGSAPAQLSPTELNAADSMASNDGANMLAEAATDARPVMQTQVILERLGFGPGVIDGKMGLSTENALKGLQEAHDLPVTGKLDDASKAVLENWNRIPSTRRVTVPPDWVSANYQPIPDDPAAQAKMQRLGYTSLDERLAERFHTTVDVLRDLNRVGESPTGAATPSPTPSASPSPVLSATPASTMSVFKPGQSILVPNIGGDRMRPGASDDRDWLATLASLGVGTPQPHVEKIVVDKSEGWLKGYDEDGKLVAMFTVTTGSSHDPLPLGNWDVKGVAHNPPFAYNPDLFWDVSDSDEKQQLPPGPNGPVGVVWIDLSKEHYGIHGTPEPQAIGRTQSHGCVRLTNWDAARLAEMVSGSTKVVFQA